MSSLKWGMIACPTPSNSQVRVWKLRQLLFSHQSRIVLLTALHSDVLLGSAGMPVHFGLSLCNLLEQISPPYPIWKGTYIAFIWSIEAAIQQEVAEKWLLELFKLIAPRMVEHHARIAKLTFLIWKYGRKCSLSVSENAIVVLYFEWFCGF